MEPVERRAPAGEGGAGDGRPVHRWPVRIYYEDTDHGGVVYHANYLRYMERARTELLRAAGVELDEVERRWGVLFAVTRIAIDYRAPARFNDLPTVCSRLARPTGVRVRYHQRIERADDGLCLSEAQVDLACIARSGRPRRIPPALLQRLCAVADRRGGGR